MYLKEARDLLSERYHLIAESRVYCSQAVDYQDQPDFFNQVLEFTLPALSANEVMTELLNVEKQMGRTRVISRGPRIIDLDIIFWGLEKFNSQHLIVPHPRWAERSFVVRPLQELPFFQTIEKCFTIPRSFDIEASPI